MCWTDMSYILIRIWTYGLFFIRFKFMLNLCSIYKKAYVAHFAVQYCYSYKNEILNMFSRPFPCLKLNPNFFTNNGKFCKRYLIIWWQISAPVSNLCFTQYHYVNMQYHRHAKWKCLHLSISSNISILSCALIVLTCNMIMSMQLMYFNINLLWG